LHVARLREILGNYDHGAVIESLTSDARADDVAPYVEDWMRKYRGQSRVVLRPTTTEQVSAVLQYCNDQKLAVVAQGGNTGLVGGSVPVFDEIVISMGRMNRVLSFDDVSGVFVAEAGCILEVADQFLAERGHAFPLDLGAKGSCQLGGNVSTNAGGLRVLRYGSLHGSVIGLEAVLPDGTIVDEMSTLRKNNTGYDLKQLFIGAEGTIGIVTKVVVQCPQRPKAVNVAYFGLESFSAVKEAFSEAKAQLSEILSAFELMDGRSQEMVHAVTGNRKPLESDYPFYCLVETSGSNGEHDYAKLEAFLEDVMGKEVVLDGVVAQDETQTKELWAWRESIPEALSHYGGVYKYDVSIPIQDMYRLVEDVRTRLEGAGLASANNDDSPVMGVVGYGHMGDSNLHLNVGTKTYDKRVEAALEPFVYEWIQQRNGSISAEHGLGIAKKKYIGYSRSDAMVGLMKQIKGLYDPVSCFPDSYSCPIQSSSDDIKHSHEIYKGGGELLVWTCS
jgi:FAD/FMN-containing dehydrogenase